MNKTNTTFWSTRPSELENDVERLCRHLTCTIREFSASEAEAFHTEAFDHLVTLRDLEEKFEKIYLARHEHERQVELSEREEVLLETDDGQKIKFSAPYGFDSPSSKGSTIYCFDMYDLHLEGGKIESAKTYHLAGVHRDLSPEELEVCNSLMQRM